MSELMEKEVYNAAVFGNVTIFNNKNEYQLLKKTSQNNNILHLAAQHGQIHFIQAVLDTLPTTPTCESLICDQNHHGNTPLHIAAEVGDEAVVQRLYEFFWTQCGSERVFPWRVTNNEGNTPAHVALLYNNVSVAMYLVEKDGFLARITNHFKKTLLHLAIQYHVVETQGPRSDLWPIIELLLKIDSSVTCWKDAEYGIKDSWFKLMSFAYDNPLYNLDCYPIAYRTGSRHEVLCRMNSINEYFWYNVRDKDATRTPIDRTIPKGTIGICKGSLIDFPSGRNMELHQPK